MSEKTDNILKGFKKTKDQNAVTIEQGKFLIDGFDGVDNPEILPFTKKDIEDAKKQGNEIDPPLQERIDDYTPFTRNIDNRLVEISSSITTLKTEIKNLIVQAVGNTDEDPGCGTLTGLCTVYGGGISTCLAGYEQLTDDLFQVRVQNMSSRSYIGLSPEDSSTSTLSSSNVGVGSFNSLTKDGGAGIGYTVTISSSGGCATYYNQVTAKFGQIDTLRAEADNLISNVNTAKRERGKLEIERWGILYNNQQASEENSRLDSTASSIQSNTIQSFA
tara:strand:- start:23 stop:847 length:825 start_codon:yes stop_codon:yes gene_type:complete